MSERISVDAHPASEYAARARASMMPAIVVDDPVSKNDLPADEKARRCEQFLEALGADRERFGFASGPRHDGDIMDVMHLRAFGDEEC